MTWAGERAGIWTLTEKLGQGGMAEVWRGEADDGTDVAVKLLPATTDSRDQFASEAGAVARLVHPHIIRILDYGHLADARSTPFLALELAEGPSLESWLGTTPITWTTVLDVSRRVLQALAHAHSRGLVHRDIKPANILAMDAAATDWRLTDFGIAFTEQRDESTEMNPSGTPRYMAPEQFIGRVHAQGPWTDLYSYGCVLYELLTGHPPFHGQAAMQLAFQHLRDPAPQLDARFEVPDGVSDLIAVLLRKNPTARFRSAADVLRALEKLPRLSGRDVGVVVGTHRGDATLVTPELEATVLLGDLEAFEWTPGDPEVPPTVEPTPPPTEPPASSPRHYFSAFHGDTGPGITQLRELPFVGRIDERRRIWAGLHRTIEQRHPHIVTLRGGPGIGKSAVGTWLTRAIDEHGFGVAVHVDHPNDPSQALLRALGGTYRLNPDDRGASEEQLRRWTAAPRWATAAVAAAFAGDRIDDQDLIGAALTVLWAQSESRPVVLFFDDVDRDRRWLDLVRRIAEDALEAPVFVVAATSRHAPELSELSIDELVLEPFGLGECAELVAELIGLGREHAYALAKAVDGHPQYALDVVQDWIGRGLLIRHGGEWTLRGGERPPLPESVAALQWERFEQVVANRPIDRAAIELLACFGTACAPALWRDACQLCELEPSPTLEVDAIRAGLLNLTDSELRFEDRALARRIVEARTTRNRQRTYHHAIATVVRRHPERWGDAVLGRHLYEAGDHNYSRRYLLRALRDGRIDVVEFEELLHRYEQALEALNLADSVDAAWGALMRARLLAQQSKQMMALPAYRDVISLAQSRGWAEVERDAITSWAHLAASRAPSVTDAAIASRGIAVADTLGQPKGRAAARNAAGAMFGYLGKLERALECYEEAREIAQHEDHIEQRAEAHYGVGWVRFLRGELQAALEPLDRAIDAFQTAGNLKEAHLVVSFKGDVFRALGDLDAAELAFTTAYEFLSRFQVMDAAVPANFALLEVARGRYGDALRWARRARELGQLQGRSPIIALASAVELIQAGDRGDTEAFDRALDDLDAIQHGDDVSYDSAYILDAATRVAVDTLDDARVRKIAQRAIRHWDQLGRTAEAMALRTVIDS